VAALDYVRSKFALNAQQPEKFKLHGLFGVDQDPVVTALAIVNMIFRNDGRNHIIEGNSLAKYLQRVTIDGHPSAEVVSTQAAKGAEGATKVLMNPPFALRVEPEKEYHFVQHALEQLQDGGLLFSILPISVMFESGEVKEWRLNKLLAENTLLSVMTFPPELFYPTGNHTLGIVIRKGIAHPKQQSVLWVRAMHDGFVKVKGKRLLAKPPKHEPDDLKTISPLVQAFVRNPAFVVPNQPEFVKAAPIDFTDTLLELVPEAYLDARIPPLTDIEQSAEQLVRDTAALAIRFPELWSKQSQAFGDHAAGNTSFVSNGFSDNGVLGYVTPLPKDKIFKFMGICVSAFGEATVQHPPFMGRGNGGSGLVVLEPIEPLDYQTLLWYAACINRVVRWRFSFGRMVTCDRIKRLELPDVQATHIPVLEAVIPQAHKPISHPRLVASFGSVPLLTLFTIKSGDFHKGEDLPEGSIPLVSCGGEANGIMRFVDVAAKYTYKNALTVAYNGQPLLTKYHPYEFAAKDDVAVLTPKVKITIPALLFIQMMLNQEVWRYSYGRKCFREKLSKMSILLPLRENKIDQPFMASIITNTDYWSFLVNTLGLPTHMGAVSKQPQLPLL